jgi:hypothetical protein
MLKIMSSARAKLNGREERQSKRLMLEFQKLFATVSDGYWRFHKVNQGTNTGDTYMMSTSSTCGNCFSCSKKPA